MGRLPVTLAPTSIDSLNSEQHQESGPSPHQIEETGADLQPTRVQAASEGESWLVEKPARSGPSKEEEGGFFLPLGASSGVRLSLEGLGLSSQASGTKMSENDTLLGGGGGHSASGTGNSDGLAFQPGDYDVEATTGSIQAGVDNDNASLLGRGDESRKEESRGSIFSVAFYRPYFDVDTADILLRVRKALLPTRAVFLEGDDGRPDLYGPFWLCTTLVFVMAVCGNLGSFMSTVEPESWDYSFAKLAVAGAVLYSYIGLVPLVSSIVLRYWLSVPLKVSSLICVFGYSLAPFVPAAVVCIAPSELVRWLVLMILCGGYSAFFLMTNIRHLLTVHGDLSDAKTKSYITAVMGLQVSLAVFLKLYFFT